MQDWSALLEGKNLSSFTSKPCLPPGFSESQGVRQGYGKHFVEACTVVPPILQPVGCCPARCVGEGGNFRVYSSHCPFQRGLTESLSGWMVTVKSTGLAHWTSWEANGEILLMWVGEGVSFWEPFKSILPTTRTQLRERSPGALVGPAH